MRRDLSALALGWLLCLGQVRASVAPDSPAAGAPPGAPAASAARPADIPPAPASPCFEVRRYQIRGDTIPSTDSLMTILAHYTGTNVSLAGLVNAASTVQVEYRKQGRTNASVSIASDAITNGLVTMNIFRGAVPLILISGKRYASSPPAAAVAANTNAPVLPEAPPKPPPTVAIRAYEIHGDTLLSEATLTGILTKYTGTNVGFADIQKAGSELQAEYRARGFPTVKVVIPAQNISTNHGLLQVRVFEGRLAEVLVQNNHYFSSNNIRRALPSLHTNQIISSPVLTAELGRANANQDRQIYPVLDAGPEENTTLLLLKVKDRLPLHAKLELNNQSSPGTPDLRVNASAVYNNLWQLDHSVGVQYSFSPEVYKTGSQWAFYDQPEVANYSAFYRMPLGNPEALSEAIASRPGSFGYDEATRQFHLPPPSGRPELNFYASRSTIDTGLMSLSQKTIEDVPGVLSIGQNDVQEDLTVNQALGSRLSVPLPSTSNFRSSLSGGVDYKTYNLLSSKTNIFYFSIITRNELGAANPPVYSTVDSPVPATHRDLDYFPLSLRYDGSLRDPLGITSFGLGLAFNSWYSGSATNLQKVTGSSQSSGNWVTLTPNLSRDLALPPLTNWVLSLRASGQWASEPLISNEQFGIGGVASVRGYREGEILGDNGWWISAEEKTPTHLVGWASAKEALTVRGSLFMDYGQSYLIDPQGRQGCIDLWGTGVGFVAAFGPHWEARFLFSLPLISAGTTSAGEPRFNFALTGQF